MVAPDQIRRHVELTSLLEDLEASGRRASTRVLAVTIGPGPDAAVAALRTARDEKVCFIERVRYADGKPLALMHNWLAASDADIADITAEALERHGLYQILRGAGIRLKFADQTIGARAATTGEARLLHERKGAPLLTMTRTAYDDTGRPLEYGTHVYRASVYSFELTLMTS
jgi:DNA-binding GntR family transcriptional regulator